MQLLRDAKVITVVCALFASFVLVAPLPASAASQLIQQASGGCNSCSHDFSTASFGSSVTSGSLILVGVSVFYNGPSPYTSTVTDSLGSSFTQGDNLCNTTWDRNCVAIFYATAPSSGADTVTVTANNANNPATLDIFIYDLSGVTTVGATYGTGQSSILSGSSNPISASSTSFTTLGFLMAVVNSLGDTTYTAGAGFTATPPTSGTLQGFAEYSLSGVSTPTTFPGTMGSTSGYTEAGIALDAAAQPAPPQVSLPPVIPSTLSFNFNFQGAPKLDGHLVSLYGNGILYNVPGYNSTTDVFPYVLSFCSVPGADEILISGFGSAGPGNNSSEIFVSNWTTALTSSQGWPAEPACAS